ncbi:tRNA (N6-threonylcarbamoyladenosine(37)-N6)-methyltransferase TrmO [Sulfolobaceae archaeon RB850M]
MILKQIGVVKHKYDDDEVRKSINGVDAVIEIFPEYEEGLKGIDGFSHIIVVSYLDRVKDYVLTVKPRGLLKFGLRLEELPELGVFSTDSPARPNPIGISVVKLKKRVVRELYVEGCDLFNNTPVIDIKPLATDKIPENVRFPDWYERLLRLAKERSGIDLRKV